MIMSGCAAFAKVVGPTRIEAELLPQWWEQVRVPVTPSFVSLFFKANDLQFSSVENTSLIIDGS